MNSDIDDLIASAQGTPMTPEQWEKQRRSFAFGNANIDNPNVTREIVDLAAEKMKWEELRIWTDGTEAYIAETIEDAMRMQRELSGDNPCEADEWGEDERAAFTIIDDPASSLEKKTTKRREDWIAENGPGFLYSSEY